MKSKEAQVSAIPVQTDASVDERIRARAYELYVERGMEPGNDIADWLQAEQETLSQAPPFTRRVAA